MHVQIQNNWGTFANVTKGRVRETRLKARAAIGNFLRNRVFSRLMQGMGAYGKLAGYSTRKFYFSPGHTDSLKKMIQPVGMGEGPRGGKGKSYPGGYKAYVQEVTGQSDLFKLKNTGDLWIDFKFFPTTQVNEPIMLGFSKANNAEVAGYAEERRPGIFQFTQNDLDEAMVELVRFLSGTWSGSEYYRSKRQQRI